MPDDNAMNLITEVDQKTQYVRTRALDISFNEILDMYRAGELIIDPDYQRLFRWSIANQSRFVESMVLEMPIPPIFVIEVEDNKYELIDGLQRISTYLHFRGELTAQHRGIRHGDFLVLEDCDIIQDLNGKSFRTLPSATAIKLKRHFIRMEVIRKESDKRLRYHMFKRLNTGGESLSSQEIRNCTIRLLDARFNDFLIALSRYESFSTCLETLTDEQTSALYDQELVLRFFSFKNWRENYVHEVGDFMTDYMEQVSDGRIDFHYTEEERDFKKTFDVLSKAMADASFGWANKQGNILRAFSAYHYEALTLGIQPLLTALNPDDDAQMTRLRTTLIEIKKDPDFIALTQGGGKNSRNALKGRIEFVESRLRGARL